MKYYKSNGEVYQAVQFNRTNFEELCGFTDGAVSDLAIKSEKIGDAYCILHKTDYGDIELTEGDYVIKIRDGRYYAMKPDMFLSMYYSEVIIGQDCK